MSVKTFVMKWMFKMMGLPTCEEVDRFAYAFLEEELDPETMNQIQRHLKTCKNCGRFMESYRRTRAVGKNPPDIALESEFKDKMLEFLSKWNK